MAQTYPLMLDVSNRQIVLIGGGTVAARKAAGLLAAAANRVRAVAPEFQASFPPQVERRHKRYDPGDLEGADLIFAATDSTEVNDAVVRDANQRGIWVNRADRSDELPGDFSTPAQFQSGSITVTVSAGSAALSAMVRDQLLERCDPNWAMMADAMKMLRPLIKAQYADAARRSELFRSLATAQAIDILRKDGIDGLKRWISNR